MSKAECDDAEIGRSSAYRSLVGNLHCLPLIGQLSLLEQNQARCRAKFADFDAFTFFEPTNCTLMLLDRDYELT